MVSSAHVHDTSQHTIIEGIYSLKDNLGTDNPPELYIVSLTPWFSMMERILICLFHLGIDVFSVGYATISTTSFEYRDTVFELYPLSVWEGEVKARQLENGNVSLCADDEWSAPVADQICKDLGFSKGSMLFGDAAMADGGTSASCIFRDDIGFYCRMRRTTCKKAAWVSCQFPGLLGCFPFYRNEIPMSSYIEMNSSAITIQWCIKKCHAVAGSRNRGYIYAGLVNGQSCYCGDDRPFRARVNIRECSTPCVGNQRQACGGRQHIALYESMLGSCGPDIYQVQAGRGYLASPGFPGHYSPGSNCFWSFQTTFFDRAKFNVLGLTKSREENLKISAYEIRTAAVTSELTWEPRGSYVLRGTTKLTLNNSVNAGFLVQFVVKPGSLGNKQFIITFEVNDVPDPGTISPMTSPVSNPSAQPGNSGSTVLTNYLVLAWAWTWVWIQ